jgi:hypothetical protein
LRVAVTRVCCMPAPLAVQPPLLYLAPSPRPLPRVVMQLNRRVPHPAPRPRCLPPAARPRAPSRALCTLLHPPLPSTAPPVWCRAGWPPSRLRTWQRTLTPLAASPCRTATRCAGHTAASPPPHTQRPPLSVARWSRTGVARVAVCVAHGRGWVAAAGAGAGVGVGWVGGGVSAFARRKGLRTNAEAAASVAVAAPSPPPWVRCACTL